MEGSMKICIEVGAFDGTDTQNYINDGYFVYTFEPKEDLYQALVTRFQGMEDSVKIIRSAVCLTDGVIDFHLCCMGGASSILKFKEDEELNRAWGEDRFDVHYSGLTYQVPSVRLDTFIESEGLVGKNIDYIHIDAQGADLDVLKSTGQYLRQIERGVIESAFTQEKAIYSEQNNTVDTCGEFMGQNGFHIDMIMSNDPTDCECNIFFHRVALP